MAQLSFALHAFGELLRRYIVLLRQAWHERRERDPPPRLAHELQFLPAHLELVESPPHPAPLWTARILSTLILAGGILVTVGQVDIIAKARGKVIPSGQTKTVASVDTATVRAIHVAEGQKVKAGEVLLELDATALLADVDKASAQESAARLEMARSRALLAAIDAHKTPVLEAVAQVPPEQWREAQQHLEGQYADFTAKLAAADTQIAQYDAALPPAREREHIYASLLARKDVARDAWLEKQQALLELESRAAQASAARETLIAQTRREALDTLAAATETATNASEDVRHARAHAIWRTLRSPVDGTVQQLSVHTVGGVVQAAEPLMHIVPDAPQIEVEATLNNKDIGFIFAGQPAQVKVDAFDYTKYGTVAARVEFLSHDAVEAKDGALLYTVRLLLDRATLPVNGQSVALSPGMAVNVDIKTGRRRVVEYVLSPLLHQEHDSFHER